MSAFEWNSDAFIAEVESEVVGLLHTALGTGVEAARGRSRVRTGRYRDGWQEGVVEVRGSLVHGEIINECENTSGGMYARYVSAGTSRMQGDFAHAAALDAAATALRDGLS